MISSINNSIWPMDGTNRRTTTPGHSELGSNANEDLFHIPQTSTEYQWRIQSFELVPSRMLFRLSIDLNISSYISNSSLCKLYFVPHVNYMEILSLFSFSVMMCHVVSNADITSLIYCAFQIFLLC